LQAKAGLCKWAAAVAAARRGEALAGRGTGIAAEFAALLDRLAVAAALVGSDAGFDGRCLEARAAEANVHADTISVKLQRVSAGVAAVLCGRADRSADTDRHVS
jgi:hypothetical protein